MKSIPFLFLLVILTLPFYMTGQPKKPPTLMARLGEESYRVTPIGVENGLSQGSVYTIFKDSRGFMWFSSQEGLNRYDGLNFRIFRPDETARTAMWGSNVVGIIEDPYGNLWIGTEECLNRYVREKDEFQHVFAFDDEDGSLRSICYPFYADDEEVWFYNDHDGIVAYNYRKGKRQVVDSRFRYQQNNLTYHSILRTPKGDIWLRSNVGLTRLPADCGEPEFYFSDHPQNLYGEPSSFYSYRYHPEEDVLWLGGDGEIIRFDPATRQAVAYPFGSSSMVFDLARDHLGRYWIGTDDAGLLVFDPEEKTFREFSIHGHHQSLRTLATVFVDDQGVTWVCSDPHGIYKIIPNYRAINLLRHDPLAGGLRDNYIRCFSEDRSGKIWVGTQHGGVAIWDPERETFDYLYNDQGHHPLPDNAISSLITDQSGRTWIGTENGLACYDPATGSTKVMHRYAGGTYQPENYIRGLIEAGENKVLFTSETGLFEAAFGEGTSRRLPVFRDTSLTTLYRGPGGRLFVASYFNGFFVVDPADGQWQRLGYFLPGYYVNCFYFDAGRGRLWLGTNKGVWEFAYQEEPFQLAPLRQFTEKDGLPSSYVYAILPDDNGNLWLSSNRGISRFDPQQGLFRNLGPKDGLQGYEFNTNAYLRARNGVFYFGGVQGMNYFLPTQVRKVPQPTPRVIFTDLQVSGRQKEGLITDNGQPSLSLDFANNSFFLSFVAPEYFCDGEIKYRHRLTNYEQRWSEPGYTNTVRYIQVPPGEYIFQVQAMNCDGQWSEEPTHLTVRIRAPWWRTPLAHLVYVAGFALLILGGYRFYSWRKLERQEALHLKELDEYRNRFYTNITHEFRTPLTSILGMGDRIEGQPEVRGLILRNGYKLLDLVNQMLEISRLEAGQDDLHFVQSDIQQFIRYTAEPFELVAADQGQAIEWRTEPDPVMMDFDPLRLERILVNLLSNALKFTPGGGTITLETRLDPARQWFLLRVADTGVGIDPEHLPHIFNRYYRGGGPEHLGYSEGTGIGLALVRELTIRLGGQIRVESEKGRGTAFNLKFPVRRNAPLQADIAPELSVGGKVSMHPSAPGEVAAVARETGAPKKPLILVVEDNPDVVSYLTLILQDHYQVEAAINGRLGLAAAIDLVPDLVISDIMMPELDGCRLCQHLKKDERTSHIPIILLTAKAGIPARISGLEVGADVYLEKPFHEGELLVRIDQLLQLRRSLQRHYRRELIQGKGNEQEPAVSGQMESSFLAEVRALIRKRLGDPDFSVVELGEGMLLSQPQLYRKLKALTGKSPHQLIRDLRLGAAGEMMQNTFLTVKEVAFDCGFNDPDYFSRLFKEYFGVPPTEYRRQNQANAGRVGDL